MVPIVRLTLRTGRSMRTGVLSRNASWLISISLWSRALPSPWSCPTVLRRGAPSGDATTARIGMRSRPLAFQCSIAAAVSSRDTSPMASAKDLNPRAARCSRTSWAMYSKNVSMYSGKPVYIETFFEYIAQEVREHLAALGFRSLAEAIGEVSRLDTAAAIEHWKASGLDLTPILTEVVPSGGAARHNTVGQDHGLGKALDH